MQQTNACKRRRFLRALSAYNQPRPAAVTIWIRGPLKGNYSHSDIEHYAAAMQRKRPGQKNSQVHAYSAS